MLRSLFQWFDQHPESYWAIAAVPTFAWCCSALLPLRQAGARKFAWRQEIIFLLLGFATVVAWRWPYWLNANPYNPDESQFIAGALTLTRDPVFWRSVDGTTSGPLNFYALLPLHALGLPLDYFSARLTALLLIESAVVSCYGLFRSWYGTAAARLALLPLIAFFAAASDADFLHFSSEHVPLALTALAASGLLGAAHPHERRGLFLACGVVAGSIPWAKLQGLPIAAVLVGLGAWRVLQGPMPTHSDRLRLAAKLLGASALPSVFFALMASATGQLHSLYRDYFLQNFFYVDQGWPLLPALQQLWRFSRETSNFPIYAGAALSFVVLAALVAKSAGRFLFVAAGVLTLAAGVCIAVPKRAFLHYTLLAVIPLGIWLGISLGQLWQSSTHVRRGRWWVGGLAVGAMLAIFAMRTRLDGPEMFGHLAEHWRRPRSAAGNIVHALLHRSDRLAVWGWMDRTYVETGLPQATHESHTFKQIAPSPQRTYYRERYVADLKRTRPAFFVDATGAGAAQFTDRGQTAHETVPALAEFVQEHYQLLTDLGDARIYVSRERVAASPLADADLWQMIADARRPPDTRGLLSVAPKRLYRKRIDGRTVQMMLPPAEMVWALDGTEREILLEYGFDPEAYASGQTKDAEVIVELRPPEGAARALWRRSLDPRQRPDDRGLQVSKIVLPPFPADSKLIIRTTPGEAGDNAWDWIYVGALDRVRAPFYAPSQFPGFSRLPTSIVSAYAAPEATPEQKILIAHAPTTLSFRLRGNERRWQFDYGFQTGAYTGEGNTDGATFIVELRRSSSPPLVLFERQVDPAHREADRERLVADIPLPPIQATDELIMRIEPGASAAWDWTYLAGVRADEAPSREIVPEQRR